jgi:hypothetical protein
MSKIHGVSFALALVAIPALVVSASAVPANRFNAAVHSSTVVYGHDGQVIGQDPDPSIRAQLVRDQYLGN